MRTVSVFHRILSVRTQCRVLVQKFIRSLKLLLCNYYSTKAGEAATKDIDTGYLFVDGHCMLTKKKKSIDTTQCAVLTFCLEPIRVFILRYHTESHRKYMKIEKIAFVIEKFYEQRLFIITSYEDKDTSTTQSLSLRVWFETTSNNQRFAVLVKYQHHTAALGRPSKNDI